MPQDLITVIVPVYNVKDYVGKCIQSILNQSYKNFELIIVDDGSTDGSGKVCDTFLKDKRVTVFHNSNHGVSYARNFGIEHSKGKYITFVDSDDYLYKDHLLNMISEMDGSCELVVTNAIIEMKNNTSKVLSNSNGIKLLNKFESFNSIYKEDQSYPWNKLFIRKIIIDNSIRFDEKLIAREDSLFCFQYINEINNVKYLPEVTYHYIYRSESAVHRGNPLTNVSTVIAQKKTMDIIESYDHSSYFYKYTVSIYSNVMVRALLNKRSYNALLNYLDKKIIISDLNKYYSFLSDKHKLAFKTLYHIPFLGSIIRALRN